MDSTSPQTLCQGTTNRINAIIPRNSKADMTKPYVKVNSIDSLTCDAHCEPVIPSTQSSKTEWKPSATVVVTTVREETAVWRMWPFAGYPFVQRTQGLLQDSEVCMHTELSDNTECRFLENHHQTCD